MSYSRQQQGFFTDETGKLSSGRLQTNASVFTGVLLAILIGVGEWHEKEFSDNLFILTAALTVGGAGMKGLQKFSESGGKPAPKPTVEPQSQSGVRVITLVVRKTF